MADMTLHDGRQLTEGLMKFLDEKQRVITEAVATLKFSQDSPAAASFR